MGLRIIDRPRPVNALSEAQQLDQLTHEMQQWSVSRGGLDTDIEKEFIKTFKRVRGRIVSQDEMLTLASRIETSIRAAYVLRTTCHREVDIATLLALL